MLLSPVWGISLSTRRRWRRRRSWRRRSTRSRRPLRRKNWVAFLGHGGLLRWNLLYYQYRLFDQLLKNMYSRPPLLGSGSAPSVRGDHEQVRGEKISTAKFLCPRGFQPLFLQHTVCLGQSQQCDRHGPSWEKVRGNYLPWSRTSQSLHAARWPREEVLPQHRQVVVQHLWKNKLILIKSILSIVVNNNIKCFNYRWIGGEYGRGGRFPEGCQETRLPKLAGEREYRFLVVCESSSDITNLRDVQSRDIRVLLAGQSSLNTLNVIERVLFTYPSIEHYSFCPGRRVQIIDTSICCLNMQQESFGKLLLFQYSRKRYLWATTEGLKSTILKTGTAFTLEQWPANIFLPKL